jgi:hypothetical protein
MTARPFVLALLLCCAAGGAEAQSQKQKRDRYVITQDEVASASANSALDVVEQLRPEWLRRTQERSPMSFGAGRSAGRTEQQEGDQIRTSAGEPQPEDPPKLRAFIDGTESDVDDLKRIPKEQISELRFLTGSEAQTRYGPRFAAGVIELRLRTT